MKRYLFVLKLFLDDGKSTRTIYRSFEANSNEEARTKLNKYCAEHGYACVIKHTYIEI